MKFTSICVQELEEKRTTRPHTLPIYATSSFDFESVDQGLAICENHLDGGRANAGDHAPIAVAVGGIGEAWPVEIIAATGSRHVLCGEHRALGRTPGRVGV